jgi:hypothetical protein
MANKKLIPDFILKDIADAWVRENFFRLQRFMQSYVFFRGDWTFVTYDIPAAVTDRQVTHGLIFKPTDIIQTSLIGPGALTWNYDKFDSKFLSITTTGPCTVRAFVGAYREDV